MKKNNKGFMLVEALVMSMVVIGTLTFMYIQFQNISRSYEKSFNYNTITDLYITNEVKNYLINNNLLDTYKDKVTASFTKYTIIDDITDSSFEMLKFKGQVKTILLTDESLSELKGKKTSTLSEKFNDFINYLKVDKEEGKYRLLIEFNDDTFASLKLNDTTNNNNDSNTVVYWDYNYKDAVKNTYEFDYTGALQQFLVPVSGNYKLEVWGAQGGDTATPSKGGKGGYASGTVYLTKNKQLFVYVGGEGLSERVGKNSFGQTLNGGFNGGGKLTGISGGTSSKYFTTGGGATDIRVGQDSLYARVIVAGGGGSSTSTQTSSGCAAIGGNGGGGYQDGRSSITNYNGSSCYGGNTTDDIVYNANVSGAGLVGPGGFLRNPDSYNKAYSYENCTSMSKCENFGVGRGIAPGSTTGKSYCSGGGGWFGAYSGKYSGGGGGSNWTFTKANYDTVTSTISDFSTKWLLGSEYYLTNTSTKGGIQEGNGKAVITYDGTITSNEQVFTAPDNGTYKIELLSGRGNITLVSAGSQKYVTTSLSLSKGQKIYIAVGQDCLSKKWCSDESTETSTVVYRTATNPTGSKIIEVASTSTNTSTIPSDIPTTSNNGFARITLISKN